MDPSALAGGHDTHKYPPVVAGRVAHLDADFMAYQVSAERAGTTEPGHKNYVKPENRKTFEDMKYNARRAADHLRKAAGAESYVCHVTPTGSNKGGRDDQAIQREYQANRKARTVKPEFLDAVRDYIAGPDCNGIAHYDQEADDGMATAAWGAEDSNKVIVVSADKDLLMVPGLHMNPSTLRITNTGKDQFGSITLDESKSAKKIVGRGTKFFWAQVLVGDTADNIQGLPQVAGSHCMEIAPTQAYTKAYKQWMDAEPEDTERLLTKLRSLEKPKPCGPALAYKILKDVKSDLEAFKVCKSFYQQTALEGYEFRHWKTDALVTPTQALFSEMQLLWMRRSKNPNDVLDWLKSKRKV